jgi:hypothetical protein
MNSFSDILHCFLHIAFSLCCTPFQAAKNGFYFLPATPPPPPKKGVSHDELTNRMTKFSRRLGSVVLMLVGEEWRKPQSPYF